MILPDISPLDIDAESFKNLQESCETLTSIRDKAKTGEETVLRNGTSFNFISDQGLLYLKCTNSTNVSNIGKLTLVVPHKCRDTVLHVAHENLFAGHFSHRKTEAKIRDHFFWPCMGSDI